VPTLPLVCFLPASKSRRIRTYAIPLPHLLYNQHLQTLFVSVDSTWFITSLDATLTRYFPANPFEFNTYRKPGVGSTCSPQKTRGGTPTPTESQNHPPTDRN